MLGEGTLYPPAFVNLAGLAARRGDGTAAEELVDLALAAREAHPEVLRCALRLAHGAEAEGLARSARVGALARALLERVPDDAGAVLALAQSMAHAGETRSAIASFARVESLAPRTAIAAQAQRARFALAEPMAWLEVDSVLRAASHERTALDALSARARRLAAEHPVWPAWLALGSVERQRGAFAAAREALTTAVEAADGAADAHRELARTSIALGDAAGALRHAERAIALGGESPRVAGDAGRGALRRRGGAARGTRCSRGRSGARAGRRGSTRPGRRAARDAPAAEGVRALARC